MFLFFFFFLKKTENSWTIDLMFNGYEGKEGRIIKLKGGELGKNNETDIEKGGTKSGGKMQ